MTTKPLLLIILLVFAQTLSAQTIYRTTDEHGTAVFTDQPPQPGSQAEEVQLRETNTTPAVEIPAREDDEAAPAEEEPEPISYSVSISAPANETTIAMGPGNFSLTAVVEPALEEGVTLQLFVDEMPWGEPQTGESWALTNVFRGAHDLTVAVLDAEGETMAISDPVRVYVLRPSILRRSNN